MVLSLLQSLANYFPVTFRSTGVLGKIPEMLDGTNELIGLRTVDRSFNSSSYSADAGLKILPLIGGGISDEFPQITRFVVVPMA